MLATILDTVFDGLLIGTTGYAIYTLKPDEYPFTVAASAVGFCHGCARMYIRFFDRSSSTEDTQVKGIKCVKEFTTSCLQIVSVPLINIDFYNHSQQTSALALGHGLFIIPLVFDLSFIFFASDEDENDAAAVLKDLTLLGNIVSLLFFAINENNLPAGIMGLSVIFAYYISFLMESVLSGTGENSSLAGYSLFYGLITLAIEAGRSK